MRQPLAYLAVASWHVSLGFTHGSALPDPHHLLEGTGKRMRHVKFRNPDDGARPGLVELIQAAAE
ncbi:MAG: DUF1801 domain-containing protein, partial [Candidatus Dormibacteria bacterium]